MFSLFKNNILCKFLFIISDKHIYTIDNGDVFVWGYGILGLGPQVQRMLEPTLIPNTLFGNNIYNRDSKVI